MSLEPTAQPALRPGLLALLEEAKTRPHDDGPRLVLADFLAEHADGADSPAWEDVKARLRGRP